MASLAALGAVVAVGDRRFVVVGHRMTRDGDSVGAGYALVPYPLGFVDADSLRVVPASAVSAVVAPGFDAEAGRAHLAQIEELARANMSIFYDEYAQSVRLLQDFAQKGGIDA